ncbi:uncharacterized protein LOC110108861 [Dendrobium catenatum]|uniref:Cotton fiber protein n=1 Tax=Dendrobium catenatum TaxID=906689 RepID=A0A2I0X9H5_9ASPA|nr:uncharacterized protein LOC110108861 [Dendrobium catenatum]PKU84552.1 hypothetical protein MA16_Dca017938 [Dendrobium catenatum]
MIRKRNPVLKRAWGVISLLIITMRRKRKPNNQKQLFKNRRFKLHHYNYTFVGEYEFSPSSTPPFHHLHPLLKKRKGILSFLLCGSKSANADGIGKEEEDMLEATAGDDRPEREEQLDEAALSDEEDESVDGRAERFIEKFYEEMRIQRQESIMHYRDMLIKNCI